MANIPLFTELDDKTRKDPLGPGYLNALAMNQIAIDNLHVVEHLDSGEHNAAEIARTMGRIRYNAGYTLEGFNSYASLSGGAGVYNPAVGDVILTLSSGCFDSDFAIFDVTNMSETGSTKPVTTSCYAVDDTHVEFFSQYLTTALGAAGNAWAAEDCNLSVAVHSTPLTPPGFTSVGVPAALTSGAWRTKTNHNNLVQANSELRARYLATHTSAGAHNVREVAKAQGYFNYSGGYSAAADAVNIGTVTTNGTGDVTVAFGSTLSSPTQVFVNVTYPRTAGLSTGVAIYAVGCPRSTCTTTDVRLYFYGYNSSTNVWNRADCDFFLSVHGA